MFIIIGALISGLSMPRTAFQGHSIIVGPARMFIESDGTRRTNEHETI